MKQVLADKLSRIAGTEGYHERATEFGQRAWLAKGKFGDIIYWDTGNGWCDIIKIVPRRGNEEWVQEVFDRVEATDDE